MIRGAEEEFWYYHSRTFSVEKDLLFQGVSKMERYSLRSSCTMLVVNVERASFLRGYVRGYYFAFRRKTEKRGKTSNSKGFLFRQFPEPDGYC
jgi:hypothetical protein